MSCEDCEKAQAGDESAFFRWGTADIELRGCRKHVAQVMSVLRATLDLERTLKEMRSAP